MPQTELDPLDRRILDALAQDARQPLARLARRLGIARTTLQARIARLERSGAIAGYTIRRGPAAGRAPIRATVLVQAEPRATPTVLGLLKTLPQVELAHSCSGRFDLVLEVAASSTAELDAVLDRIGAARGVKSSESLIHLSTRIDRRQGG